MLVALVQSQLAGLRRMTFLPAPSLSQQQLVSVGRMPASTAGTLVGVAATSAAWADEIGDKKLQEIGTKAAKAVKDLVPTPDAVKDIGTKAKNVITRGALDDKFNDPSTPEGAAALGLAQPVPRIEDLPQLTGEDVFPVFAVFGLAVLWGIFGVPAMMERADGTKTTYFEEKKEKVVYTGKMLDAAMSEIVPSTRRLSKESDTGKKKKRNKVKTKTKTKSFEDDGDVGSLRGTNSPNKGVSNKKR